MPWLPYLQVLPDEGANRERGLRDVCEMVKCCYGIVLVGGRVSSGMQRERDVAEAAGLEIINLTGLGDEPPTNLSSRGKTLMEIFAEETRLHPHRGDL
jgi:hypothetical protein